MEVNGKIIAVAPMVRGTSARGEWAKAIIVVEYEGGQFPKSLVLSNMNKADAFASLKVGQKGKFKFDGSTRQAQNGNWYMDLNCWAWDIDASDDMPF